MAITIIVEDGSVVANANSFQTLAEARTNSELLGLTISADDAIANTQLAQGYMQLVRYHSARLKGYQSSKTQTGIFPRVGVYNNDTGYYVESNEIPQNVIYAQLQYSHAINACADMNKTADDQELSGFSVDGVYSETYKDGSNKRTTPSVPAVNQWLRPFMNGNRVNTPSNGYL